VAAQLDQEWKEKGRCEHSVQKAERLSAAAALTTQSSALANLSNLYRLMLKSADAVGAPDDLTRAEIQEILRVVDSLTATK
jgi:hypothetical protein